MNDRDQVILRKEFRVKKVAIWVEVIANEEKITEIIIDTKDGKLAKRGKFPAKNKLAKLVEQELGNYFKDPRKKIKLPLFQHSVPNSQVAAIKFLESIPVGETRSYQDQAKAVANYCKNKFTARNAGNANRRNHYPIVIPCHRVVRKSGDVGGFMGSNQIAARQLKQALLLHEQQV